MSLMSQLPIILKADQEHSRLRLVVLLLLPPAVGLGFLLTNWLVHFIGGVLAEYVTFLSCVIGLVIGFGVVYLIERQLKEVWPSGDQVILAAEKVAVHTREGEDYALDLSVEVFITNWYFCLEGYPRVGNERRTNKGWYCLASQLRQGEQRLVVYTFMSPAETAVYTAGNGANIHHFHLITPSVLYDQRKGGSRMALRPPIPPELLRSKDGRFWLAERQRWTGGLELTPQDFQLYLEYVAQILPHEEQQNEN